MFSPAPIKQYLKKNIPFGPALLLAIFIHLSIFMISSFTVDNSQTENNNNETKRLITLEMGLGANKNSGHGANPAAKSNPQLITRQQTSKSSQASTEETAASATLDDPQGSIGAGSGTGAGFGFEESIVNFKEPGYPITALKRGIEGTIKVRIKISEDGNPVEITILNSSNNKILDNAALKVIPEWHFQKRPGVSFYFVEKTFIFKIKS